MKTFFTVLLSTLFALFTHNLVFAGGGGGTTFCGQTQSATIYVSTGAVAIPDGPAVVTSTINVAGSVGTIGYMSLFTSITHTFAADLDITLQSPAGTVVTLTTDNGAGNDDVFNGVSWRDNALNLVTDFAYTNGVAAPSLIPEEAFGAFIGEDPNGTWTLTVSDDLAGDGGSLDSWSIDLYTYAPITSGATSHSNAPNLAIPDLATTTSNINVAGLNGTILDVNAITNILHTFAADLDISITSPQGTNVVLTTDNGGGNDNVFSSTTWDDNANPAGQVPYTTNDGLATDHLYVNLTTASPLVPEGALAAFIGEDPNGVWAITIVDDLGGDEGTLVNWQLDIATCGFVPPASDDYFADDPSTLDCLAFNYFDIGTTGVLVVSGDDNSVPVTLDAPLFFYDDTYTQLAVTTNGYLSTNPTDNGSDFTNDCPLPALLSSGGGSRIYPLHDDLVTDVYYEYFAVSPVPHPDGANHAAHIFQWVGDYFSSGGSIDLEAIIYDNGDIVYQYNDVSEGGSNSTSGMQHESLGNSTTYACNTPNSITAGLVIGFSYGDHLACPPPANDLCADAVNLFLACGETVFVNGTNIDATADNIASDCNDGSPTDGGGVWYSVVGTGNNITASLCGGAGFDTELSVYTGACAALVCAAGNDDFCGLQSQTTWASTLGITYYILVHGFSLGTEGNFTLSLSDDGSEPNDSPCQAISIDYVCGGTATIDGSTLCATYNDATDLNCNVFANAGTVWYVVYGNGTNYTVSTCADNGGSNGYDTQISVFSGNCETLNCIDGNDDTPPNLCSTVSWNTDPGEAYYIMVHGFFGSEGDFTLAVNYGNPVSCNATGTNITCFGAANGTLSATATGGGLPYTFVWSGPGGPYVGQNVIGLPPGTYTLNVTDEEGCTCTDEVTLTQPLSLTATLLPPDQGNGGELPFAYNTATVIVAGGTAPYSFDWDNSGYVRYDIAYTATGATITVYYTDNASWEVTISDNNDCRGIDGNDIVMGNDLIGINDLLDITNYVIGGQNNAGTPNGSINITVSGGNCSGNYLYQWSGPNGFTADSQDLTGLVSGWYSVTVTCGSQTTIGWYWITTVRRGRSKIDASMLEVAPNPLENTAIISFALPHDDVVNIDLYDMSGRLVANLYSGNLAANELYEVPLDAGILPAGAYLCRLSTQQGEQLSYKVWLIK